MGWSCGSKRAWKLLKIPIASFSSCFFIQAYHGFTRKQKEHFWCKICQCFSFLSFAGHTAPGPSLTLVAPPFPPLPQFPSDAELCALSQPVAMAGEPVTVCHHPAGPWGQEETPSLLLQGCYLLDLLLPHSPSPWSSCSRVPLRSQKVTGPCVTSSTTFVCSHFSAPWLHPQRCPQLMSLGSHSQLGSGHGASQELLRPPGASPQHCPLSLGDT